MAHRELNLLLFFCKLRQAIWIWEWKRCVTFSWNPLEQCHSVFSVELGGNTRPQRISHQLTCSGGACIYSMVFYFPLFFVSVVMNKMWGCFKNMLHSGGKIVCLCGISITLDHEKNIGYWNMNRGESLLSGNCEGHIAFPSATKSSVSQRGPFCMRYRLKSTWDSLLMSMNHKWWESFQASVNHFDFSCHSSITHP